MEITFLGTSSAVPSKYRNHAGIILKYFKDTLLFDCGEGTGHWRPHLCCLVCPGSVLCEYKVDHLAKPYIGPKIFLQIFRSVFSSVCYYFRLSTWQFWFH